MLNSGGNAINSAQWQMSPNKPRQVAKFYTPLPDKYPVQIYFVLEIKEDTERPRADIRALNTGLSFPPVNKVLLDDLKVVEVETVDLIGHEVNLNMADYSQAAGKVVKVSEQKIMLDLTKGVNGVETNVWLTLQDKDGKEHTGTLFVN